MQSFQNLVSLLQSLLANYNDLKAVLIEERNAIVNWQIPALPGITNKKDSLLQKEHILDEARKSLVSKICEEKALSENTLTEIINACSDEDIKKTLSELRDGLYDVAMFIQQENSNLKNLYTTNLRLINDLFAKIGYTPVNKYGLEKNKGASSPSTISTLG